MQTEGLNVKFIVTEELGRLAKWLRMLGFDTVYFRGRNFSSLMVEALREDRIILTANRHLSSPKGIKIIFIRPVHPKEQIQDIFACLKIKPNSDMMFTRCILCNERLLSFPKEEAAPLVPAYVFKTQEQFFTCPQCKRIYWQGSHLEQAQQLLRQSNLL